MEEACSFHGVQEQRRSERSLGPSISFKNKPQRPTILSLDPMCWRFYCPPIAPWAGDQSFTHGPLGNIQDENCNNVFFYSQDLNCLRRDRKCWFLSLPLSYYRALLLYRGLGTIWCLKCQYCQDYTCENNYSLSSLGWNLMFLGDIFS
jgi:hypothetical protein